MTSFDRHRRTTHRRTAAGSAAGSATGTATGTARSTAPEGAGASAAPLASTPDTAPTVAGPFGAALATALPAILATTLAATLGAGTAPALAQTDGTAPIDGPPSFLVVGAGALAEYEGADALQAVPLLVARTRVGHASLEITGTRAQLGLVRHGAFHAGPVLGFTGARDDGADDERVASFEPVDSSLELGAFAAWRAPLGSLAEGQAELGATVTSSVGGDWEGTQVALGGDYSWAATSVWRLAIGASATVVDDAYAVSRFGVSAADSRSSGLAAYEPAGGLKDASLSLRSILSFSPRYGVFTRVAYTRLLGDAADSPIVAEAGSVDQTFVGAGLFVSFRR